MGSQPTISIAALGRMGQPIAANVMQAGYPAFVWNRTPDRAAALLDAAATWADSPGSLAQVADIALSSLVDP